MTIQSIDKDEVQEWMRHPVTKFLLARIGEEATVTRYRAATDVLSLGQAQGFDEAVRLMGRLLGNPTELSLARKSPSRGVSP